MITLFNRRKLLSTFDMQQQGNVKMLLGQNNIDFFSKVINMKSPSPFSAGSRCRTGSFGENPAMAYEYIIYVKKKDYAKALNILKTIGNL